MKVNRPTLRSQLLFAGIALGVLVSAGYADAASTLTHHFDSETLDLRHLIGEVRVEQHGGSGFEVEVQVAGRDARDGMIELRTEANRLDVLFPGGHSDFIYPALGRGSTSSIEIGHDKGELFHGPGGAGRLRVRGQGDGLELWADVVVRVPSGGRLEVDHAIGAIRVEGVDAELELATDSGRIEVHDSSGEIAAATGSGEIELVRTDGKHVGLATGSGTIRIESSSGDTYEVGAGSGNVSISGL
ncbi:MAG TPA: DUF4097 family beta strand repeat-containing protein, partial [Candidatus Polarisedimenticolaceae bacterium]|nr:DUF4097 family beta strand repeat-containing protein [Candidatus Polarisedimenticolaceae bacterium]